MDDDPNLLTTWECLGNTNQLYVQPTVPGEEHGPLCSCLLNIPMAQLQSCPCSECAKTMHLGPISKPSVSAGGPHLVCVPPVVGPALSLRPFCCFHSLFFFLLIRSFLFSSSPELLEGVLCPVPCFATCGAPKACPPGWTSKNGAAWQEHEAVLLGKLWQLDICRRSSWFLPLTFPLSFFFPCAFLLFIYLLIRLFLFFLRMTHELFIHACVFDSEPPTRYRDRVPLPGPSTG